MAELRRISQEAPDEALVLRTVHDLAAEIHPRAAGQAVRLDSRLDADVGLDSLALVELRVRIEDVCSVHLPERSALPRSWRTWKLSQGTPSKGRRDPTWPERTCANVTGAHI